ncbi:SEC-C motif-containing protein [Rhizobium sp. PP-F2F-G38]|nr:SEC-C motif-containing protein [Rhizobium sp. PP-F2F-G38]
MRQETEIFEDLSNLCQSPGYVHALAGLCFRDTSAGFARQLNPQDLAHLSNPRTLIRTELNTLFGLMMNGPIGFELPSTRGLDAYVARSDQLLQELHDAISLSARPPINVELSKIEGYNPFASASVLREPIFYAAESAYPFQYRDLAARKYSRDRRWLLDNRGLDVEAAADVCKSILGLLNNRLFETLTSFKGKPVEQWTLLPGFTFSASELAEATGLAQGLIRRCLDPFCVPAAPANSGFTSLTAFNGAYAYPLIKKGEDEYVSLQPAYGYSEALYEAPFYWMGADKAYETTAMKNRGSFAEDFAFDRLTHVFGSSRVFKNVEIMRAKGKTLGEIDVLVLFGDRAIVVQAKSKKLTLAARNGSDRQLKGDFKAAVQDAVDQAFSCASLLEDPSVVLRCRDGDEVKLPLPLTTVFPMALLTDHYPALAFQAQLLLTFQGSDKIVAPLVSDVFTLDAITEMLETPLRFLSYVLLRAKAARSLMVNHELVALSYHLQNNLWIEADNQLMILNDDISVPLDLAMAARRDGVPAEKTPKGILTKFAGTIYDGIVKQIEKEAGAPAISLGFALMELGEAAIDEINRALKIISRRASKDGRTHDFSLEAGAGAADGGFTFHVGKDDIGEAERRLYKHCRRRKYLSKSDRWHGVLLQGDGAVRLVATLHEPWKTDRDYEMSIGIAAHSPSNRQISRRLQIGRNDPCPCGSGDKYKKCCLNDI